MTAPSPTKSRATWWNLAGVILAFGLLAAAIAKNRVTLRDVLSRPIDGRLFALGFGIYLGALLITFGRWYLLVREVGLTLRYRDAVRLGFIGNVFNLVVPGAVGGDVIKALVLARANPDRKTAAWASMIVDRLLGLAGLFLLAGVAGAVAFARAPRPVQILIGSVWLCLAIGLAGLLFLFATGIKPGTDLGPEPDTKLGRVGRGLRRAAGVYRARPALVVGCLLASSTIHGMFVVAFYLASRAILPMIPTFADHFLIVPLVLFSTAIPIPFGALGLTENISALLFGLGGGPGDNGAVAMMAFRTLMYAGGLVSLAVYLANLRWIRDITAVSSDSDPDVTPEDIPGPVL